MRQGQAVVKGEQLAISIQRREIAADQIHVEGPGAPPLPPHAIRGNLHFLGRRSQPCPSSVGSSAISTALRNGSCSTPPQAAVS